MLPDMPTSLHYIVNILFNPYKILFYIASTLFDFSKIPIDVLNILSGTTNILRHIAHILFHPDNMLSDHAVHQGKASVKGSSRKKRPICASYSRLTRT
jgi:hypothetical protein